MDGSHEDTMLVGCEEVAPQFRATLGFENCTTNTSSHHVDHDSAAGGVANTSASTSLFQEADIMGISFGAIELGSVIVGLVLNPITLPYFYRNRNKVSSLLYLLIVMIDIGSLLSSLPSAISMICDRAAVILSSHLICSASGFLFNITARVSVFLIALLGVERAVTLHHPFKEVSHRSCYVGAVTIYLVMNVILASLPLLFSTRGYYYHPLVGQCSWGVNDLDFVKDGSLSWQGITYSTIILPWLVPGVVVMVTCTISMVQLLHSDKKRKRLLGKNYTRRKSFVTKRTKYVSMTIIIMTLVYFIFNVPCWLFYLYLLLNRLNPVAWLKPRTALYIHIFVSRLSVSLNATCNPIVYFCRMSGLRKYSTKYMHSRSDNMIELNYSNAMRLNMIMKSRSTTSPSSSKLPQINSSKPNAAVTTPPDQVENEEVDKVSFKNSFRP